MPSSNVVSEGDELVEDPLLPVVFLLDETPDMAEACRDKRRCCGVEDTAESEAEEVELNNEEDEDCGRRERRDVFGVTFFKGVGSAEESAKASCSLDENVTGGPDPDVLRRWIIFLAEGSKESIKLDKDRKKGV